MLLKSWERLVSTQVSLNEKAFYGIGGCAEFWAEVDSLEDLHEILQECQRREIPWRVLGGGTNLLIQEGLLRGLTIRLHRRRFGQLIFEGSRCTLGTALATTNFVREAALKKFGSVIVVGGIPGTVGGALAMNAGTPEGAIGDLVVSVTGFDQRGNWKTWSREDCEFGYRSSHLQEALIVSAVLDLGVPDETAIEKLRQWVQHKTQTQPYDQRSAGCMFQNPPNESAGKLIESVGLKGKRLGDMEVSSLHANFLINHGQGTFDQARDLMKEIRDKVHEAHDIVLKEEVVVWENSK